MEFLTSTDLFGFRHIVFLVISIAIIVVLPILAIKYRVKTQTVYRILLIVGIVSESIKIFSYIIMNEGTLGGYLPKTDLPFQLCSIQLIFILLLNFSKNEKLKHLLQSFMLPTCLVGGIAAIVLATYSSRAFWWISVQYFGFHSAISAFSIYLLANKEIKFTIKDYRNTLIMLVATLFVAIYLNSMLYTQVYKFDKFGKFEGTEYMPINFMYVINPPSDGLPFLNKDHGWFVYIIHYACLAVFAVTATYIMPIIEFFKNLKNKRQLTNN